MEWRTFYPTSEAQDARIGALGDFASRLAQEVAKIQGDDDAAVALLTARLGMLAEQAARVTVHENTAVVATVCAPLNDAFVRLFEKHAAVGAKRARRGDAVDALSAVMVLWELWTADWQKTPAFDHEYDPEPVARDWIRAIAARGEQLSADKQRTAALAAAALGEVDLIPRFTGGGPIQATKQARSLAAPDVLGLARHLGELIKGKADNDALSSAYATFAELFPLVHESFGARFIDLWWAAVAVETQLGADDAYARPALYLMRRLINFRDGTDTRYVSQREHKRLLYGPTTTTTAPATKKRKATATRKTKKAGASRRKR